MLLSLKLNEIIFRIYYLSLDIIPKYSRQAQFEIYFLMFHINCVLLLLEKLTFFTAFRPLLFLFSKNLSFPVKNAGVLTLIT